MPGSPVGEGSKAHKPKRRNRDTKSRTADVLVDVLVETGVEVVFGVPGGAIAPLYDALIDRPEIQVVITRHEGHAVFAAAGYAQTTGKLGVVLVTSGPGVLNTFNGLGSAYVDGLPVLLLAGEAARAGFGRGAIQEGSVYAVNIVGMASHVTKLAFEIPEANAASAMLRRAMSVATSGKRGPVLVSLPLNVLGTPIVRPTVGLEVPETCGIPQGLDHVVKALQSSDTKTIFVGSGVRWGKGPQLLRQIAERLQCPVMTTPKAKGVFPESHPLSLGVFGMGGHDSARKHLAAGVDVLLVVGTSLNEVATDGWSEHLAARRSFVHVDIDATRIGRVYPTDIGVPAPAALVFGELLKHLPQAPVRKSGGITFDRNASAIHEGAPISAPRALWELQQVLPHDTIYTGDSGINLFFATHYLTIDHPDAFVCMLGLGSMGTSIGLAVGAQIGHPQRTVVSICGDGGFHMAAAELSTAAKSGLPIIVVVLNNGALGMVQLGNGAVYGRTPDYSTAPLCVGGLARASGADSLTIEHPGDILTGVAAHRASKGVNKPLVLDVRFDPAVRIPTNRRFETIETHVSGKMVNPISINQTQTRNLN
ncbi:MAG: hypothetical protein A2289_03790 [Deltaproteobacteria bacterium RIFOXYA12_FULL_58_15]|nr:MAG: hypothetical protein A2289_03790 [Deltaproteobacteria bacterium RIFOXYA12_FULL_58_15]OGR07188.1 MAG: hypothetical protein A2341_03610 [Deltaproteobacteria bacterium RIFOXYB12_FULL_58_9]